MKRILYELKAQPLIAAVTVVGTALAIFLIMVVVMMQQVKVDPFGPEPHRNRTIYADRLKEVRLNGVGWTSSSIGIRGVHEIFDSIPGIERISVFSKYIQDAPVGIKGQPMKKTKVIATDDNYWKIFAHNFLAGHPYDSVQCAAGEKLAVVSKSVASRFWASPDDAIDKEIMVNRIPRKIVGVVDDVTPLATNAYSQVWTPMKTSYTTKSVMRGSEKAAILIESPEQLPAIRDRVSQRIATINSRIADEGIELDLMGAPFSHEEYALGINFGDLPDLEGHKKRQLLIYIILLIVPAVNLAGMTQSRLRRRTGEIGVRRAFGATRASIFVDLLVENFIVTLAAGIVGLVFSLMFAYLFGPLVFADNANMSSDSVVSIGALFHWSTFGLVLLFCFVLNILSTGIPALRASRVNPVNALNGHQK